MNRVKRPIQPTRQWPDGHAEFMKEFKRYTPEQKRACVEAAKTQIAELMAAKPVASIEAKASE